MAVRRSVIQAVVDENPVVDLIFAPDNKLQIMPRVSADIEIRRVIFTRINDVFDKGFVRAPFRENPQVGWKIQCKLPPKTKRFCPLVLK